MTSLNPSLIYNAAYSSLFNIVSSHSSTDHLLLVNVSRPHLSRLLNTHTSMTAEMAIKVGLLTGDKKEFVKNYEGKYRLAGGEGPAGVTEDVSNQALLEMVKEISRDPELVEFIQNNIKGASLN
jgi:plasmid maintenance system antidote protein VapI